ncbi:hypothetical protein ZWY2020_031249 [Hordeum vulgare]|nr:hypothetical protein ZWY2020_031249 [Hordeum vulgare]
MARGAALLALICCCWLAIACSAAAQVVPDGHREPRAPPSPQPGNQNPAPVEIAPPPPSTGTLALAPHRKTLQQAVSGVPRV